MDGASIRESIISSRTSHLIPTLLTASASCPEVRVTIMDRLGCASLGSSSGLLLRAKDACCVARVHFY